MDITNEIERIRDLDDELFEVFTQAMPMVPVFFSNSSIPMTSQLLLMFITGTNFIKNSIFDCIENDDIYSAKILFRSLIEHFLRFKFVLFNHMMDKNDSKSDYYFTILEISEYLNYSKSINSINQIYGVDVQTLNEMWDELCTQFPKLKSYPRKEIEEFSRNFSIKNIIKYLTEKTIDVEKDKDVFLSKMILEYSDLSSYVHGGILAYKSYFEYANEEIRNNEQVRIAGLAYQLCGSIKLFSYLVFFQHKPEFGPFYNRTSELLKKI